MRHFQWIKGDVYCICRHWVPCHFEGKLSFVRKWFKVMDRRRPEVPYRYRYRRNPSEFADAAAMVLCRVEQMLALDIPFVAGSRYLTEKPWALFGQVDGVEPVSYIRFRDFEDIVAFYRESIMRGSTVTEFFHFRVAGDLVDNISTKSRLTPSFILMLGLHLLHDILMFCGPDCDVFYDLFVNDSRVRPEDVSIQAWADLRCSVLGQRGMICAPYDYRLGQLRSPPVPLVSGTWFEPIDGDDLASGCRTVTAPRREITVLRDDEVYIYDSHDESEFDEFLARAENREKYGRIGL